MFRLRAVVSPPRLDAVLDALHASVACTNVVVFPGAAREPRGDVVECDVAREGANAVIAAMRDLEVHREGGLALVEIAFSIADGVAQAEAQTPGLATDAVVWEHLEARLRDEGQLSWSFVAFVVAAVLIAAIGVLLDSPILIVGAMVVGPEYGPLAAISFWIHRRRLRRAGAATRTLVVGMGAGVGAAIVAGWIAAAADLVPERLHPATRPQTGFIFNPDVLSLVVAVLAGAAGMLSLAAAKSGTLIGVLISVTTIPAAAGIGVAVAVADWPDAAGAALQLVVNFVGIVVSGAATLAVQRRAWQASDARLRAGDG